MKSKKAAMEMSVGTIVTIVLLMTVLILGIFLIQKIFSGSSGAIETINSEVESQIEKLFSNEGRKIAVYPTSQEVTIKKGDDPKGFAFSIRNNDIESATFTYEVEVDPQFDEDKCGSSFSKARGDQYLLAGEGSFELGPGNSLDLPILVKFDIPESAAPCTIIYNLNVKKGRDAYTGAQIFVTVK